MQTSKHKRSNRLLIIITVIFIIIIVVVGVVTWKVTKDKYEEDDVTSSQIGGGVGDGDNSGGTGGEKTTQSPEVDEELLEREPWRKLRLPRTILPVHYDVIMYPDFYGDHAQFYGNETIELNITAPSPYIFIHVDKNYISITDTQVYNNKTQSSIPIKDTFTYEPNQFLVIRAVEGHVFNGVVLVGLQFHGVLNKSIVGIYKSSYVNSLTKQTRYLVSSKFEPTYARRAFPCLDEPNMKAEYTITLIHDPEYIALSNMDVDQTSPSDIDAKLVATKFHRSVEMSTYLVCFIVCDFDYVETKSRRNITIRVYATPDKQDQTQYALEMAKYTMDYYETLFEQDYPLPKQDLIAVPDFVSGAMEHWGLITFRETALLYNVNTSTMANKKRVATVVAHEMAHMWFGNLVTMDWWNDLWLNEGFASYMEYIGVEKKEKDWNMDVQFLDDDMLPVMNSDAVVSSHPIIVTVNNPSEITSVFDAISYNKGASVIRMLKAIMGEVKFFKGVAKYLRDHKWGNARTDDLWEALTEVDPSTNVKAIMDTWTIQDGFPYINISVENYFPGKTTLRASQQRFMSDPRASYDIKQSPFGYKWYVSLDYFTSKGNSGLEIINKTKDIVFDVSINLNDLGAWIKFNKDKQGFYRVLYPESVWISMIDYLKLSSNIGNWTLGTADRADLLSDALNLAAADHLRYEIPLELLTYLKLETNYVPWAAATNGGLRYITYLLHDDPQYAIWRTFRLNITKPTLTGMGFEDKGDYSERRLRSLLFDLVNKDDDVQVTNLTKTWFRQWLDQGKQHPLNFRQSIYSHGMRLFGTDNDWDKVWGMYLVEVSPSEKSLLMIALTSTTRPNLIAKLLDRATRAEGIRRQDFFTVIYRLSGNTAAMDMVWEWMRETYSQLEERFTPQDRYFGRMAYYLVGNFKTQIKLEEVKKFFQDHPNEGSSARYRKMALESIQRKINWLGSYRDQVVNYINSLGIPSS